MKHLPLAFLFLSCVSQDQIDAGHELAAATVAATDPAGPGGAQVTPEEEAVISSLVESLKGADGVDWQEILAGAGVALASIFPILRLLPNSLILGKKESAALDKVAGIPS